MTHDDLRSNDAAQAAVELLTRNGEAGGFAPGSISPQIIEEILEVAK